jgi:ubiquinone/menaquinone biosynthesis C-methylase UbiE
LLVAPRRKPLTTNPAATNGSSNIDPATVAGFGLEWSRYDQSAVSDDELRAHFSRYFAVFPWATLPSAAVGLDIGCGTGRWARFVSERVGTLHCIDASAEALAVARRNLEQRSNCVFHHASVEHLPVPDGSVDFAYSLGVLHHIPDTVAGLRSSVAKLKPGAPFLLYLYYDFENRPPWFRLLWRGTDILRRGVSRLPARMRVLTTEAIAATVYWPLARTSRLADRLGLPVGAFPLSSYRDASFYTMRTDALDRFGTRLEQRFSRADIQSMMTAAGLERIQFGDDRPFWCAVGYRKR